MSAHGREGEPGKAFFITLLECGIAIELFIILWRNLLVLYGFTNEPWLARVRGRIIVRIEAMFINFLLVEGEKHVGPPDLLGLILVHIRLRRIPGTVRSRSRFAA
jgi:hypothetical protein